MALYAKQIPRALKVIGLVIFFVAIFLHLVNKNFGLASRNRHPNFILITIDSLRPDHLSCYGYIRNTSPHIDKLAKEGLLFKNAYVQSNWTVPSITSLMTSTYPHTHRVTDRGFYADTSMPTLPEILKYSGYTTGILAPKFVIDLIRGNKNGIDDYWAAHSADIATRTAVSYISDSVDKNRPFFYGYIIWMFIFLIMLLCLTKFYIPVIRLRKQRYYLKLL